MKPFMDQDFLLETPTARHLFHDMAEGMPIIDYHCHLDPREICEDRRFENITRLWLGGDHYKWRLMRSFGVEERFITGHASDREKFQKWAETLALAIGNPLYHWSHMELRRYFGYEGILNGDTAEEVWTLCNEKLRQPEFSARNLILRSRVQVICTTDDPADSLKWHQRIKADGFPVQVLPSFRPDKALGLEKPDYLDYLQKLGGPRSYGELAKALQERLAFFVSLGCRVSDHGLESVPFAPASEAKLEAIYKKRLTGEIPTAHEIQQFKTGLLLFHGTGCVVDRPSAFRWYLRAAELGNIAAMNDLAYCLINGFGIPANPAEGFAWALRAAEKGHSPSQVMVGECYMSGTGTKADGEKALLWLRRAAMQGNNRARMLLRDWPTDGSSTEPAR